MPRPRLDGREIMQSATQYRAGGGGLDDPAGLRKRISALAGPDPLLKLDRICAGYASTRILHGIDLQLGAGQSICLIGPNGAGKSTVLNAIYGFAAIYSGSVIVGERDATRISQSAKLKELGIAYLLQGNSVFPDMTVEQNLQLGGYLKDRSAQARAAADRIFDLYPRLAARRRQPARMLSGGERRLLEIARALVMNPRILLVDEPSIGIEPRFIEMVFEVLHDLQHKQGMSIVMVEQNVRKGLTFADIGYLLVAGEVIMAAPAAELLRDRSMEPVFATRQAPAAE